jgi:hypothetical protein
MRCHSDIEKTGSFPRCTVGRENETSPGAPKFWPCGIALAHATRSLWLFRKPCREVLRPPRAETPRLWPMTVPESERSDLFVPSGVQVPGFPRISEFSRNGTLNRHAMQQLPRGSSSPDPKHNSSHRPDTALLLIRSRMPRRLCS